jgi:hypothetical protein
VRAVDEGSGENSRSRGERRQDGEERPRLSVRDATAAIAVVIASAKNQNPTSGLWYHGVGCSITCVPTRMFRIR